AKVAPVIAKVRDLNPSIKADFIPIQLDDFDSVRKAAAQVNSLVTKLHVVINNAGVMAVTNYTTNKNNIESQFVTNHLGHFLLTALLFSKTEAAGQGARIINLSSHGHRAGPFRGDDYNFNAGADYNPWSGYGQAKTANILFSRQLATRLANRGIQSFAVHPGTIHGTTIGTHIPDLAESFADLYAVALRNTGEEFGEMDPPKSKQQGAATTLVTALDPSIADRTGTYWKDCHETEAAG
ncbi:MAG: Dehydrogenase reductase SDR member 13, partial [Watsoniomyces obsoletus]